MRTDDEYLENWNFHVDMGKLEVMEMLLNLSEPVKKQYLDIWACIIADGNRFAVPTSILQMSKDELRLEIAIIRNSYPDTPDLKTILDRELANMQAVMDISRRNEQS